MHRVVYADLLFLVNFGMDLLCLFITSRILHRRLKNLRATLSSALGGVYSVLSLFVDLGSIGMTMLDLLFCVVLCLVCFGRERLFTTSAVMFGVSVGIGGMMTAIYSLLNRIDLPLYEVEANGDGISVWLFAILALISGAAATCGGKFFKSSSNERLADVEINYKGRQAVIRAMTDTGNLIKDPMSGKPIIVAERESLSVLLGYAVNAAAKGDVSSVILSDPTHRVRLVPINTAAGASALCAFVPDKLFLIIDGKRIEADALFAPSELNLGADKKAIGCAALLPPSLI